MKSNCEGSRATPQSDGLALPLEAVDVSYPGGWDFGWCVVDANKRVLGYCMTEKQARQLIAPFVAAEMTPQEVFDNWSAYLRPVDREDFRKQLALIAVSETVARWVPVSSEIAMTRINEVTMGLPIFGHDQDGQWYRLDGHIEEPK